MSAIREALGTKDRTGGPGLLVPKVLAKMPDDLRADAEALLASDRSDLAVAEAFADEDPAYWVSQNAVRNYRRTNRLHRFA